MIFILRILKLSIKKFLIYRETAVLLIIFTLIHSIAEYYFAFIYYNNIDVLGGYNRRDFLILITSSKLIFILYQIFFINGQESTIGKIVDAELDYDLLKPINPMVYTSFQEIEIGSVISFFFPFGILIYLLIGVKLSIAIISFYILSLIIGVLFYYNLNQVIVNWNGNPFLDNFLKVISTIFTRALISQG